MPGKIDPKLLTPRLPASWAYDRESLPDSREIDQMLQRKPNKTAWYDALGGIPMTIDPVTRKPMVDPVLCSDGKLHERTTTVQVPYLDADVTMTRHVEVLGHDLKARTAVHEAFPLAEAMFKHRAHLGEYRDGLSNEEIPTGAARRQLTALDMRAGELKYRAYQMRDRKEPAYNAYFDPSGLTLKRENTLYPRPLSFSLNTFSEFGILPNRTGAALVRHLIRHNVLLGAGRDERFLGDMGNLDSALDTFGHSKLRPIEEPLNDVQKARVRLYVEFFEELSQRSWHAVAEISRCKSLREGSEAFRAAGATSLMSAAELHSITSDERQLSKREQSLDLLIRQGLRSEGGTLMLKRSQSLQDLRLHGDPEKLDEDVYRCPIYLDTAPAPVLCSDGHTYDLTQVVGGGLTTSPMTREPMHIVGRHSEKQLYAAQMLEDPDTEYFQETFDSMHSRYANAKVGGIEDRTILYQRGRRFFGDFLAYPDTFRRAAFSRKNERNRLPWKSFQTWNRSRRTVRKLCENGILNAAQDRRAFPKISESKVKEALARSFKSTDIPSQEEQERNVSIVMAFVKEQARREPLVAQARTLASQIAVAPKTAKRRAELKQKLDDVENQLHRLPSGVHDGLKHKLYR